MNPYITTKKQKQPNKNNRNHYIRWVMVTILFILIALFFTGCGSGAKTARKKIVVEV